MTSQHEPDELGEFMTEPDMLNLRTIARDMNLPFDELGLPYRKGKAYMLQEQEYHRLHDWNPLCSHGDALRVLTHYGLELETAAYGVFVRKGKGQLLTWKEYAEEASQEVKEQVIRRAIVAGAIRSILGLGPHQQFDRNAKQA